MPSSILPTCLTAAIQTRTLFAVMCLTGLTILPLVGCNNNNAEYVRVVQERDVLQERADRLDREVRGQADVIARLHRQNRVLIEFGKDRPVDLFAPVKIDIVSRSGATDLDRQGGIDGVRVYVRPVDEDGNPIKAPGEIRVQLLDLDNFGEPRVIGLYRFDDPSELRKMWFARFGTNHFTVDCPFPHGEDISILRRILISVEFLDYLSGRTLTANKEIRMPVTTS